MDLTVDQKSALSKAVYWYYYERASKPVFKLHGFAGTGKTTLAQLIGKELDGVRIAYVAPTNKAARALRTKGCVNARTLHSLIYWPQMEEDHNTGEIYVTGYELKCPKTKNVTGVGEKDQDINGPWDYDLIIVDEGSMVGADLARNLLSFDVPVIVIGDPFQLPPVEDGKSPFMCDPDAVLRQITRQAEESPIISLSMDIRAGRVVSCGYFGNVYIDDDGPIVFKQWKFRRYCARASQVIVGTNRDRKLLNKSIRRLKGFGEGLPRKGEKVICLRNHVGKGLLNGDMLVLNADATIITRTLREKTPGIPDKNYLCFPALDEDGQIYNIDILLEKFEGMVKETELKPVVSFGYAITAHKSQGSQWENVVVYSDPTPFLKYNGPELARKWLYTAVTRAQNKLIVAGSVNFAERVNVVGPSEERVAESVPF